MNTTIFHLRLAVLLVGFLSVVIATIGFRRNGKGPSYYALLFIGIALILIINIWGLLDAIWK